MNKRLSIALVITRMDQGGSPDIVRIIAQHLKKNHDVTLVTGTTRFPSDKTREFLRDFERNTIQVPQLTRNINPFLDLVAFVKLYKIFSHKHYDIVHTNTAKAGFEAIPERLENVSRSLGASAAATFFRVTLPLGWRSMVVGMIMCMARAVSEFGAVVIVAYHPMVAPVMIYERFTAYGLKYSQPVAVWLILVCLVLFLLLRLFSSPMRKTA